MSTIEYSDNSNKNFTFDQWTGINSDQNVNKESLNLSSKPLNYYINSLNNKLGTNQPHLSYTPIGNSKGEHVSNMFERPIPSTLQKKSSVYTHPYSTSPFIGAQSNFNPVNTDIDSSLKKGLELRSKNNNLSQLQWPVYGDVHSEELNKVSQLKGSIWPNNLGQQTGIDTYQLQLNYQNGSSVLNDDIKKMLG